MKNTIFVLLLTLIVNNTFAQSEVFFENINVGDNLEKCIAKGLVESTGGATNWNAYEWKLTDSNLNNYFQRTGVVFDNNNIIKEIELLASDYKENNKGDVDVKKSFNYILKYFTQRYSGMKVRKVNTKNSSSCLYDIGTEYFWETSNLIIQVKLYDCVHDEIICKTKPQGALGDFCADSFMNCGAFSKVNIIMK